MNEELENSKKLNMLQVLKKASGITNEETNKKKKEKKYYIPDGGDLMLYFSCEDLKKLKYDNIILSKNIFGIDISITVKNDYARISTLDNKYVIHNDWCNKLTVEEKKQIREEIETDEISSKTKEYIDMINACNYNTLFDSKNACDAYLLFCFSIFLYTAGIKNLLIYDTHEGKYLQKDEIFSAISDFMNNSLELFE